MSRLMTKNILFLIILVQMFWLSMHFKIIQAQEL